MRDKKIVVRPGESYLPACVIFILLGIVWLRMTDKTALLQEGGTANKMLFLCSLSCFLIGVHCILFMILTRIQLDNEKIVINTISLKRSEYLWSEITHAKITGREGRYSTVIYFCTIYAGERRIVKAPQYYTGFEEMFYELDKRNLLRRDDFYMAAKAKIKVDKRLHR